MSITDIGSARFNRASSSREVSIADMLREALRKVESGEIDPKHALVLFDLHEDGFSRCEYLSAGAHTVFESLGMLKHASDLMSRGEA